MLEGFFITKLEVYPSELDEESETPIG